MFDLLHTPVIIGHRGASMYAPENTIAAFGLAIQQKADAIEFDVKLCADHHVVVLHDEKVDRTTDGHGLVSRTSLSELKKMDAGKWFSTKYRRERIPTLEEVLDFAGKKIPMNIELTNYTTPVDKLVDEVVRLVKRKGLENQVIFSSFLSTNLTRVRELLPGCLIGYLVAGGKAGSIQRKMQHPPANFDTLNPPQTIVTDKLVKHEHRYSRRVLVYTVNDPEVMRNMFMLGVDGIFTDDPLTAKRIAASMFVKQQD